MADDFDLNDLQQILSGISDPAPVPVDTELTDVATQDDLLAPSAAIRPISTNVDIKVGDDSEQQISDELKPYFDKLDIVTDEVLAACRSDRQDAMDTINMLRRIVDDTPDGRRPSSEILGCLVKAIEVRSNINMTAVKIMEANAKMLAATKSKIGITNQTALSGVNLSALLGEQVSENDV